MSTQVVEISDGSIVVITDVGLNGATKQSVADEATARADADNALTAALALKAPLASPALTGTPTAPTAATATSTTQLATTAFVQQELAAGGSTARALVVSVRNQSGGTMAAGTVVYLNGATGNLPTIAKALATSGATSAQTIGLVQTSIADNGTGLVVVRGVLGNLNTSTLTEGQQLYLSPTTAGAYTTTKQYAPNHLVYLGVVTRAHPTLGSIEVAVQNGFELDELHNVSAQSPTNGDALRWNAATSLWEKSALGTLATQSGTFSGTSSGTNTGDQTATTVPNTPAGGIASTTVQAAINELDTEKANLASPTFTGNPLAPTPATTDNDTSIATTAMVQAVANAQWTQPTAIAITTAGNSNVAAATAQNRYLTQRVNVTAFTGTATVTLQNTSAIAGDKRRLIVAMPAGFANLIELRNLTSGGTLLAAVPMDGALARTWLGYSTFDGTNWGAVSFSPMSVDEFVLSRTISRGDYIQSDGATPNRAAGIYGPFDAVNNPREWIAGAASLTIAAVLTVPTSTVSGNARIFHCTSATAILSDQPNSLLCLLTSDYLQVGAWGASATDYRVFQWANFRSVYSGQTGLLKVYIVQGTTDPVVSWNGVNISSSFSAATLNTPPAWLDAAMVPTYRLVGYNWPSGPTPIVTPILGATSAADDAFYMQTGRWPAWVVAGGSMVNAITSVSRNSDFSAGATDWSTQFTATASVVSSALNCTTSANFDNVRLAQGFLSRAIVAGLRVRLSLTITNFATTGGTLSAGNAHQVGETYFTITGNGSYSGDVLSISNLGYSIPQFIQSGSGSFTFTVDNVKIEFLGALSIPAVQPINVLDDVSLLGGNQGRLLGCTPVTDNTTARICANTWLASNQRILEGTLFDQTRFAISGPITQVTTGTPTTTIGSVSAGAQYKGSSALASGANPALPVTYKLATGEIWVGSDTAVNVRTTIPLLKVQ